MRALLAQQRAIYGNQETILAAYVRLVPPLNRLSLKGRLSVTTLKIGIQLIMIETHHSNVVVSTTQPVPFDQISNLLPAWLCSRDPTRMHESDLAMPIRVMFSLYCLLCELCSRSQRERWPVQRSGTHMRTQKCRLLFNRVARRERTRTPTFLL